MMLWSSVESWDLFYFIVKLPQLHTKICLMNQAEMLADEVIYKIFNLPNICFISYLIIKYYLNNTIIT